MSARLFPRRLGYIFAALALALALLFLLGLSLRTAQAASQQANTTFVVNSTADTPDADVGNPACADANGNCSLRAAIMQANFDAGPVTVTLPAGLYLLTRSGDDDAAVLGDLDIADDLAIQGAGSGVTVVDGNGTVTGDRVFQVLATAKETSFSGLTIRNGKKVANTFDEGGGLYWDGNGSHLRLNDVVIDGNTARYGGGVYLNYSAVGDTIQMDHVIVHTNTATTGAAGGLGVNFGDFAQFDLRNSQVYSNTAYEGGGLYFQSAPTPFGLLSVQIDGAQIYSNTASLSAGFENHSGDSTVPIVLLNSRFDHNRADFYGGAIGNYGTLDIFTSTLEANSAAVRGGGLYDYEGGNVDIEQSTLSGNFAQFGGGIYSELFVHNSAALTLTNSTLSGNNASRDGGAFYAIGGHTQFYNDTIANNHVLVPFGTFYAGMGGGVYITGTAIVAAQNTVIGDNTHRYQATLPEPDDCLATIVSLHSLGFNLIETPANCLISGTTVGNVTGVDPLLRPLQSYGGPTQTQLPGLGSPAIDAGQTPFCTGVNGAAIPDDQRGFQRPIGARCDIGAVEAGPELFLPFLRK